jgi:chorismate dehydratase
VARAGKAGGTSGVGKGVSRSPLHGLRVGCVQYLNSKPLIRGYAGSITLEHPSSLARDLSAGLLDAALVPTFEALEHPHYALVDDVAIASNGPVYSVVLAHRGNLRDIRSVKLDPASRTSQNLVRVILAEFHNLHPSYGDEGEAGLIIGNQAIEYRQRHDTDPSILMLDLGEEWKRCTGLPFVYAMWALHADLPNIPEIADAFRALKRNGIANLEAVIADDETGTPEFRRRYLTEHIRFDLGADEKRGITRYRELLAKYGRIDGNGPELRFV